MWHIAVELDAPPVDVLRNRIKAEIESRMDMRALLKSTELDREEREKIKELVML
jgi:hypothetical protein